jgi:SAM-dependent methyltransferase
MSLRFERQDNCPVCETAPVEATRHYRMMTVFGIQVEYAHCDNCGILWQTSRLADDYLPEYYRDVYRQITSPSQANRDQTKKVGHIRAAIQVGWLAQFIGNRTSVLDYGCSGGWLLDELAKLDLKVYGVEMDRSELTAPARAQHQIYDDISEAPQVDIITMSHVVEHFNHPLPAMRQIYDHLKPGGLLFVDVPNYRGLPGYGTGLHHPVCYDAASLARMLGMVGFDILEHSFYDWDNTPMDKYLMMAATKPSKRQRRK